MMAIRRRESEGERGEFVEREGGFRGGSAKVETFNMEIFKVEIFKVRV